MLSFAFPLYVLGFAEVVLGLLLLGPIQLARPVISLAKLAKLPVGKTVIATLSVCLSMFLLPAMLEVSRMGSRSFHGEGEIGSLRQREAEASATLNFVLAGTCLFLLFVLQKLAGVLAEREQMKTSQQALLKQMQGLRAAYDQATEHGISRGPSSGKQPDGDSGKLKGQVAGLEQQVGELQEKLQTSQKTQRAAQANAEALRSQTKGLENEYDRLLGQHDELINRLKRAEPSYGGGESTGGRKKDR